MTTYIHPNHFDKDLTLLTRPNVFGPANVTDTQGLQTNKYLYLALNNLTLARPNWRFKSCDSSTSADGSSRILTGFALYEEDEKLGTISIGYKGRHYKIKVENDRINAKRERGSGYYTDDPAKAELAIRKNFFRLAKDERLDKAAQAASNLIDSEARSKKWDMERASSSVFNYAKDFVEANFDAYVSAYPQAAKAQGEYEQRKTVYETVEAIQKAFDKREGPLVVLDGTQYVVRVDGAIATYTDDTLTYDMKKKIGILKLVEDGQMVTDIGCRVGKGTFVLTPEKEQEQ